MPDEIRLSIRNIELAALRWRADSRIRILALHGWLDNAESFTALAQQLEYEIVALDFAGHGHSDHRPGGEVLHYVDYIVDVYEVLQALEWDQCVLMGHSMGAGVASVFASAFGQKLNGLICLDGLGPITSDAGQLPARLNKSVRLNTKPTERDKTIYTSIEQAVQARQQAGDLSRQAVERLVRRNLKQAQGGYVWRSDARLRLPSLYYLSEEQARAYMRQIKTPTLMIRPTESGYRVEQLLKQRAALVDDLEWVDVPGGHHAHMDDPKRVLAPIKTFIESLKPC